MIYIAAVILCANMSAESCFPVINAARTFTSYEECYEDADTAAQYVIDRGGVYWASPFCFPVSLGEPV